MKVFLTGGSGFVGSNLARVFRERGAELIAPSHAELDLTDRAATLRAVRDAAPDAIVRTEAGTRAATLPYFFLERYIPSYLRQWEAFVAAVTSGRTPPVTGPDARAPLVIGMAAWRSLREGRPVRIEEVDAA